MLPTERLSTLITGVSSGFLDDAPDVFPRKPLFSSTWCGTWCGFVAFLAQNNPDPSRTSRSCFVACADVWLSIVFGVLDVSIGPSQPDVHWFIGLAAADNGALWVAT